MLLLAAYGNGFGNRQGGVRGGFGSFGGRFHIAQINQLAACAKFDGAVVVGQHAVNGDHIVDVELINAGALQAETLDTVAVGVHGNSDVVVVFVVSVVDGGDGAGQSAGVGQRLVGGQSESFLQDYGRIFGNLRRRAAAALHGIQGATLSKFNDAVVVGQFTGDGDGVTDGQSSSALARQAVTLDGHILGAGNFDGDGDVLVVVVVHGIDGDDHAGQGVSALQRLAGFQRIGSLDDVDGIGINGRRDDHIPADAGLLAIGAGNGCGQHIFDGLGDVCNGFFVDVDGNGAIFVINDLDDVFTHINTPDNGVFRVADTDLGKTRVIRGRLVSGFFIEDTQIFQGLFQIFVLGSVDLVVGRGSGLSAFGAFLLTTGEHAEAHRQYQKQRDDSLHRYYPFLNILDRGICGY